MLSDFGLTNYESKVYTTLLELGTSNARQISKTSKVPYGRIYDVLHNLESLGVITSDNSRPQNFSAVDPETAINRLLDVKTREINKLNQNADLIKQELSSIYESKPKDKLVWKVAIGDELHDSYLQLLTEANREFLGYVEFSDDQEGVFQYLEHYIAAVLNMANRNVRVKILLGINDHELLEKAIEQYPEIMGVLNLAEVRLTSILPYPFTVIDGHKVILKVLNPSRPSDFLAAVYLWQESLGKTLKQQFENLWKSASPLKLSLVQDN